MVSSAEQNIPLLGAVRDLTKGLSIRGGETTGCRAAIATIENFERIPLTSETYEQLRASHRDWPTLNAFFGVSAREAKILHDDVPAGACYDQAQRAYAGEPSGILRGLNVSDLKMTVFDLEREVRALPNRALVYEAAIVGAASLERANARDIAATGHAPLRTFSQDIYYLNEFFRSARLQVSRAPA